MDDVIASAMWDFLGHSVYS